ncbi:MAG: CBS domain-containing protein [Alphaproteobacteria bacterium]|nr:CBS domain-containing protein [Alphaproteobacteria bacterium]
MTQRHVGDLVRNQKPVKLSPAASVKDACTKMRDHRCGAVLVVEGEDRLVGIFTGRDAVSRVLAESKDPAKTKLADVMTPNPAAMAKGSTAVDALRLMQDGGFRHVPVVATGKHVIGIVSRGDFRGLEQAQLDEETGLWERIW